MAERLSVKEDVAGSSPASGASGVNCKGDRKRVPSNTYKKTEKSDHPARP